MKNLFERLAQMNSRSNIWTEAEAALPFATGADVVTLQKLINADSLDEMHIILAQASGRDDEAARLREWLDSKAVRNAAPKSASRLELDAMLAVA